MAPITDIEAANLEIANLARENKLLRAELQALRLGLFGRRSERLHPGQLGLIENGDAPAPDASEPVANETVKEKRQKRQGHGRTRFPEHLPREVIELDVPEDERSCPECGQAMSSIGEDTCERGHIVPARMVVKRYVKKKYACPSGHAVKTAEAPEGVIQGGKYEASVYAHVVTSKYMDHLPLHRLEGIFKRYGHPLPKQVMWDMLKRVDELVARPVLRQMKRELLQEEVLHSDETPVTMRQEGGKGTLTGYAWEWRSLRAIETPKVLLEFKTSRGRDGPIRFLEDWSGTLITDGYSGFDEVTRRNGIVRAGCWAHARRKVKKALDQGIRDAVDVMRPVQRLFWLERAIDRRVGRLGMDQAAHLALRQEIRAKRCVRVIERIYEMVDELLEKRSTLPKSLLGKALKYLSRQKRPLSVFLDDPRVPIHNNDTERDLRHLAVGRKNWLVFGSQRGGDVACRLYSLVLSCKQAGVDPETYIEDLLGRISTTPASEIASLMPWAWAEARPSTAPATA